MLATIRKRARNPITVAIIIVPVIAAFALFGVNDILTGTGNAVATVGPERVTAQQLNRAYQLQLSQIQRENPGFTREEAERAGLGDQVLNRLVAEAAINASANELGLTVSDERSAEQIREIDAFANPFTGEFDRASYDQILRDNGMTGRMFEQTMRGEMKRQQLLTALFEGVGALEVMDRAFAAYRGERRRVRALVVRPEAVDAPEAPSEETLQAFLSENAQVFTLPERRRFTLVRVSPELLASRVEVPEEDVLSLYEIRLEDGELADPATRSFVQLAAPDAATAEAAAERLGSGESADAIAADLGLGEPARFDALEAFEVPDSSVADTVFALGDGEAGAVEGRLGWRAVRVSEAVDPDVPAFEDVQAELRAELAGEAGLGLTFDLLARFEEARAAGATLEEAAAAAALPSESFGFVTRQGVSEQGFRAFTLQDVPDVLATVFDQPEGFATDLADYGEDGYFAVRIDAVAPETLPELAEVRGEVETFWRARQIDDAVAALAEQAAERARSGEALEAIADEIGAGASVEGAMLLRTETSGPFNQSVVRAAFATAPGDYVTTRGGADQRAHLALLVEEILPPGSLEVEPETADALDQLVRQDFGLAVQNAFLQRRDVSVDQRLRDIALQQGDTAP